MSMCRIFSCVVGRGCLLWPVRSLGRTLLAFVLLHSVLQGQICLLLQVFFGAQWSMRNMISYQEWTYMEGERLWLNWHSRILAILGQSRNKYESPCWKRVQRSLIRGCSMKESLSGLRLFLQSLPKGTRDEAGTIINGPGEPSLFLSFVLLSHFDNRYECKPW